MTYDEALRLCEEALELLRKGGSYSLDQFTPKTRASPINSRQMHLSQDSGLGTEAQDQIVRFLGQMDLVIAETDELIRKHNGMSGVQDIELNDLAEKVETLISDIRKTLKQGT